MNITDQLHRATHLSSRWLTVSAVAAATIALLPGSAALAEGHSARPVLPRYYAVITSGPDCRGGCLIVHNAQTGATLATASAPADWNYLQVTGAANDTAFVIGALEPSSGYSYVFLLARFDPGRDTLSVRQLPIPGMSVAPDGFAQSPDGTKLAVALQSNPSGSGSGELRLYTLATGVAKVWTTTGVIDWLSNNQGLSWGSRGILAFDWSRPIHNPAEAGQQGIRVLNTNTKTGNLLTDSRLAVRQAQPAGYVLQGRFAITDEGREVVAVVERVHPPTASQYEVFTTGTGRVVRVFLPSKQRLESVWWADSSGSVLAGDLPGSGKSAGLSVLEWITGGAHRHTAVKGVPGGPLAIAF
jgi:hypothetical protein